MCTWWSETVCAPEPRTARARFPPPARRSHRDRLRQEPRSAPVASHTAVKRSGWGGRNVTTWPWACTPASVRPAATVGTARRTGVATPLRALPAPPTRTPAIGADSRENPCHHTPAAAPHPRHSLHQHKLRHLGSIASPARRLDDARVAPLALGEAIIKILAEQLAHDSFIRQVAQDRCGALAIRSRAPRAPPSALASPPRRPSPIATGAACDRPLALAHLACLGASGTLLRPARSSVRQHRCFQREIRLAREIYQGLDEALIVGANSFHDMLR